MFVGQKSVNTACAAFASLTSFSSPKQDATASMSACVFFLNGFCCGTPLQRGKQTQPWDNSSAQEGLSSGPLVGVCLLSSASSPANPLTPTPATPPPLLCGDSIAVCFFGERLSSATSLLAPTPPVPLLPLSSRTHCSEWKVNTATASSAGPSFVWPAQIKCFALPRRRTAAFSSSCQCQLWQI